MWCDVGEWIFIQFEISITSDIQSVLSGKYKNKESYKFFNLIVLIVKQYIFSCKYKNNPIPNIHALKKVITERILTEKYLLLKKCKYKEYESHWQNICEKL